MVISRRRFAENLKEMHGIKNAREGLSMQILWRRRCSRVVDLKLPNDITAARWWPRLIHRELSSIHVKTFSFASVELGS